MLETIAVLLLVFSLLGLVTSTTLGGFIHVLLVAIIVLFLVRFARGMPRHGSKDRLALVDAEADFERVDGERLAPDAFRSSASMRLENSSGSRSEFSETVPALSFRVPETRSRPKAC